MYRVLKPKGIHSNVTLENTETKANVILGKISVEMLNILETGGHKIGEGGITKDYTWNITVDMDTASKLATSTMRIKKPIKEQKKEEVTSEPENVSKQKNKQIDAMDVLLGLANYN